MNILSQIVNYLYLKRRGNIASSFAGPKEIASFKKKLKSSPEPLKKKEKKAQIKSFQISKVNQDGGLLSLYDVPIDLEKRKMNLYREYSVRDIFPKWWQRNILYIEQEGKPNLGLSKHKR